MANIAWLCLGREQLSAATALLTDSSDDVLPWTRVGGIGTSQVFLDFSPSVELVEIHKLVAKVHEQSAANNSVSRIEAIVVTGDATGHEIETRPGDVLVSLYVPDAFSSTHTLERAIKVLQAEIGDKGYWLFSSSDDQDPTTAPVSARGLTQGCPRLHYFPEFEKMIGTRSRHTANVEPCAIILSVAGPQLSGNDSRKPKSPENAALYARELVHLMAEPSVRTIPSLEGTEHIIPALPPPYIEPFPTYQYPRYGNSVLVVIPTENKAKVAFFHERLVRRHPPDLEVHILIVPVESDVGGQPYNSAGAQGAHNRISNALRWLADNCDGDRHAVLAERGIGTIMVACVESFFQTRGIARPADFGIIVVHNATTGRTAACTTRGVTAPPEFVARARRFGGPDGDTDHGNVTVGAVLAARVPGLDKADWQVVLAGRSRYDLLNDAADGMQMPW